MQTITETVRGDPLHVVEPRAAGLDVHKLQVTASIRLCDPGGGPPASATREFGTTPAGLRAMTGWLLENGVEAAALEGTGIFWEAPYAACEQAGILPTLLHAQQVRQLKGRKTDFKDSLWLACVCQFGLGTPSYIPPPEFRVLRAMTRNRRKQVGERSRARNRVQKLLDHCGLRLGGALTDILGMNGRRILEGLGWGRAVDEILASLSGHVRPKRDLLRQVLEARPDAYTLWRLSDLLRRYDQTCRSIADVEELLERSLLPWERQLRLLETVPGIDRGSACAILVELGPDLNAFRKASNLPAWAGLAPGNHKSAGKRLSRRARKGNPMLKTTLAECAQGAARTHGTQFQSYHKMMTARRGYKRATIATAHKLLRVIQALLRTDKPYRDPGVNYERMLVARNAPRWLRKLKQYGFLEEQPTRYAAAAS